jgi:hypothetical protein
MANGKERQCDVGVLTCHDPPRQILQLSLFCPVQLSAWRKTSKAMMVKEVKPTDDSIITLAAITCLVCQEVDLSEE